MRRALMALALALWAGCGTKVIDLGPPDGSADLAPPIACVIKDIAPEVRCLYCGPTFAQGPCLKCEAAAASGTCRVCTWSDQPTPDGQCKQCFDPNGTMLKDDCNRLRPELLKESP
jgi:hypothetical protein